MTPAITQFNGDHRYLSNFYPSPFIWNGWHWKFAECAYQAAKHPEQSTWLKMRDATPGQAKSIGRTVQIRPDWERIKFSVMVNILANKFTQNPTLLAQLKETGDAWLEEGNTWGDVVWGVSPPESGNGKNWLGLALMAVRATL